MYATRIALIIAALLWSACGSTATTSTKDKTPSGISGIYDATKDPKVIAAFTDLYEAGRDDVYVLAGKVEYRPETDTPWSGAHIIETAIHKQRLSLAAQGCLEII